MKGRLFVIDLMPFLYKGHFVFLKNPRMTASGINTSALLGLVSGIMSILKREKPTHIVLAMDSSTPTFRHKAYPEYKIQRQKMPEDLAQSIPYAYEVADALGIPVVKLDGYEADDIIGTLAVKGVEAGFEVFLATPDKDAAQLVRPGISLYRPAHSGDAAVIYDEKGVCEKWSLSSPLQMIDYLALAGDSSDNIPGIKGVGEKTAIDLLSKFGDIEGIIASADLIKGKLQEKIKNGAEDARMSKFLTTIRVDVPIEPDWDSYVIKEPELKKLSSVCAKFELSRLAKDFGIQVENTPLSSNSKEEATTVLDDINSWKHEYKLIETEAQALELIEELKKAPKIAFDTETSGVDGYDSTDAHRSRLVGFSLAIAPGKAWYIVGDLIDLFRPIFADKSKIFVGHNVKFDRSVLLRNGIGFASVPRDTMLADYCLDSAQRHSLDVLAERYLKYKAIPIAKLIGEKVRGKEQLSMAALKPSEILDYAAEDADMTFRLDEVLRPKVKEANCERVLEFYEERLVKILIDMELEGVRIDVDSLKAYGLELDKDILELITKITEFADPGLNIDSPKQLGELLFTKLGIAGGKKTSGGQYSTDEKTLSKIESAHPVVGYILQYRALSKLKSTYVDKLPLLIDGQNRVHTTYAQSFAETGRLSSSDPNLQNIPVRTERGKLIRKAFVARDENHVLVSADYSQIELRLMAAFSKDEAMLGAFMRGEDIHRDTAARVYNLMPEFVTDEQRAKCKMVNFGIIYGISAFGLSQRLKISRKEAASLIETYFKLYPGVASYIDKLKESAREKGYAETFFGRRRTLRDINSANATVRQAAERDAVNTPIQGSAADLIKAAMVKIDAAFKANMLRSKMILQIHDELVFDVPIEEKDIVTKIVAEEMKNAVDFGVPLEVSIGSGQNWLEAH
ncbi:MAG: DNA polymerase I [Kiritimatiellae bacterium]|nr:DNA polymerase I [Kiritimatiellia bacterium]